MMPLKSYVVTYTYQPVEPGKSRQTARIRTMGTSPGDAEGNAHKYLKNLRHEVQVTAVKEETP